MTQLPGNQLLRHPDRLFIGGKWVAPSSDRVITVISPVNEDPFLTVPEAMEADINAAVAAARHAFDFGPWPWLSHAERAGYLRRISEELVKRIPDVGQIWPNEMGILHKQALGQAGTAPDVYTRFAGFADTFPFSFAREGSDPRKAGFIVREPVGVVAAIIPWNAPLSLIANKLAPALLAGCTVVLKASPEAPGEAYVMAEIFEAVGLPAGVVNVVTADREVSELLVRNPGVDKVSFTGSSAAGRRIASLLGERIGRYTLELGGKSAAVILDDYDIDTAASAIAGPACSMSGQICSSLTRIIVTESRHDQLVAALADRFAAVRVGDPFDPASQIGPVAMARQRDRIETLIASGVSEGARLATGGGRPAHLNRGFYIQPTVFGNVSNAMTIAREEIFGPVLSVIPAASEDEAVAIANDTVYGLNNSVFTNDLERAYAVGRRLRSGTVGHNGFKTDFKLGFGGFKQSGIGREGNIEGLEAYLENKTMIFDAAPQALGG